MKYTKPRKNYKKFRIEFLILKWNFFFFLFSVVFRIGLFHSIFQITILRTIRTYLLDTLSFFSCDIKYIKVPNCSVMIRYREIDKDWMTKNKHRRIRSLSNARQWNNETVSESKSENKRKTEKEKRALWIYFTWYIFEIDK